MDNIYQAVKNQLYQNRWCKQKWVGTESAGLYLYQDGTEEIHHFTGNSPILSNKIIDLANDENGEVFIGTDKGVISTGPMQLKEKQFKINFCISNPVRENYRGNIAINKLIENAYVKITDINGNLCQTTANGGQANWDGNNLIMRCWNSIYLVFSTDENGYEEMVSKILFIK